MAAAVKHLSETTVVAVLAITSGTTLVPNQEYRRTTYTTTAPQWFSPPGTAAQQCVGVRVCVGTDVCLGWGWGLRGCQIFVNIHV